MNEIVQHRQYDEYVWIKLGNFSPYAFNQTYLIKIKKIRINNLNFELGAKYLIAGFKSENKYYEAWGCTFVNKMTLIPDFTSEIMQLRKIHQHNPWTFAIALADRISSNICPNQMLQTLKIGLLLR